MLALLLAVESVVVVSMPPITGKVSLLGNVNIGTSVDITDRVGRALGIVSVSNFPSFPSSFSISNFPSTYDVSDRAARLLGVVEMAVGGTPVDPRQRTWTITAGGGDNLTAYLWGQAKGSTIATAGTVSTEDANHNALDVDLWYGGSAVDPRARTWTLAYGTDSVTAYQGTSPWVTSNASLVDDVAITSAADERLTTRLSTTGALRLYDAASSVGSRLVAWNGDTTSGAWVNIKSSVALGRTWNLSSSDTPAPMLQSGTSPSQSQVLVGTTSTAITIPASARSCELANAGTNTCYYNPAGASTTSSRPVGGTSVFGPTWTLDCTAAACSGLTGICPAAAQVSGSATVLTCLN